MLRPEGFFRNRERAAKQRFGVRKAALRVINHCQIIQPRRYVRMFRAEGFFQNTKRSAKQRLGLCMAALH